MHLDPQMRSSLQLFWSIVMINIFSPKISVRSQANFFHFQMQSCDYLIFGWSPNTRNASNEEKKKNQHNSSWPGGTGILQSPKTKAASSDG